MAVDLMLCPFCGSRAGFYDAKCVPGVVCDGCGADVMSDDNTRKGAARLWNTRKFPPPVQFVNARGMTIAEMKENVFADGLGDIGDAMLVWVNEGDFLLLCMNGMAEKVQPKCNCGNDNSSPHDLSCLVLGQLDERNN